MHTKGCGKGYLYVALIVIVLMGGPALACGQLDDAEYHTGSPIILSGVTEKNSELFLTICDVKTGACENGSAIPIYGVWSYPLVDPKPGMKNIAVWLNSSKASGNSCAVWAITVRPQRNVDVATPATDTQMPKPTPDYPAEIRELEQKIDEHEMRISDLAAVTPRPIKPAITPIPTATINHSATIAALEKQIADHEAELSRQKGWIGTILSFLGLA